MSSTVDLGQGRNLSKLPRNRLRRGSQIAEFALTFIPLMALVFMFVDLAWMLFAQSTLQRAVRSAVQVGATLTGTQAAGTCVTDFVKSQVEKQSMGLLSGTTGLSYIQVHYLAPPQPGAGTTLTYTDVTSTSTGNNPGNVMQVSINNYSLTALLPRFLTVTYKPDTGPLTINVQASDVIESSIDIPCMGSAP